MEKVFKFQEAKDRTIYFINNFGEVESENYFDFVDNHAEETTAPVGVTDKLHVRENEENGTFELWTWGWRGQKLQLIEEFETEEEAIEEKFLKTEEYDVDTIFFDTEAEALEYIGEE